MTREEFSQLCRKEVVSPVVTTPCWFHPNKPHRTGYVQIEIDGWRGYIHVFAWRLFFGEVPDGLEVDHMCNPRNGTKTNRACCNPAHLRVVPQLTNHLAASRANQTHCKFGHEFTPENTMTRIRKSNGRPMRICRECDRSRAAALYAENGDKMRERARLAMKKHRDANPELMRERERERNANPDRKSYKAQQARERRQGNRNALFVQRAQEVLDSTPNPA